MEGCYKLCLGPAEVGQVRVEKQGLYYCFSARCRLSGEVMHRLAVSCGGRTEDLGVCVPVDGMFGTEKKIPCKRFGAGKPEFLLLPKHERMQGKFVPIYPEEPFSYMTKLKDAFLAHQAGQVGLVIRE